MTPEQQQIIAAIVNAPGDTSIVSEAIRALQADVARLRAALASVRPCLPQFRIAVLDAALRATCPACHGSGIAGERRSDGAPLVCTECGR